MQQKENTVPIIEPVARELLLAELTPARKMRNTHRAGNEIYIFSAAECPSLMREVVSATLRQSTSLILPACILDRRTPDSAESIRIAIS